MSEKIVSIFKNATMLHKTLGMLDAALTQHDEIATCHHLDSLFQGQTPPDILTKIFEQTLQTIESWGNPYLAMSASSRALQSDKITPALRDVGLRYYIDAAINVSTQQPLTTMSAFVFAQEHARGTAHEMLINHEADTLCKEAHPTNAYHLLQGALKLYEYSASNDDQENYLADAIMHLADTIAPQNPMSAMEAYSVLLDTLSDQDERLTPTIETLLDLCQETAFSYTEDTYLVLEQIQECVDVKSSIYKQASAMKNDLLKTMSEGDYSKAAPLTPDEFLSRKPPQPL